MGALLIFTIFVGRNLDPIGYAILGSPLLPGITAIVLALLTRKKEPITGRRLILPSVLFLIFVSVILSGIWYLHRAWYFRERDDLIEQFQKFPQITDVWIEGNDYDGSYVCYYVHFRLAGRPDSQIVLLNDNGLELAGFDTPRKVLSVKRIGPWEFHVEGTRHLKGEPKAYEFSEDSIDLGLTGSFKNKIPFEVSSVHDICKRYDDLVRHFVTWPIRTAPGTFEVQTSDRKEKFRFYAVSHRSEKSAK